MEICKFENAIESNESEEYIMQYYKYYLSYVGNIFEYRMIPFDKIMKLGNYIGYNVILSSFIEDGTIRREDIMSVILRKLHKHKIHYTMTPDLFEYLMFSGIWIHTILEHEYIYNTRLIKTYEEFKYIMARYYGINSRLFNKSMARFLINNENYLRKYLLKNDKSKWIELLLSVNNKVFDIVMNMGIHKLNHDLIERYENSFGFTEGRILIRLYHQVGIFGTISELNRKIFLILNLYNVESLYMIKYLLYDCRINEENEKHLIQPSKIDMDTFKKVIDYKVVRSLDIDDNNNLVIPSCNVASRISTNSRVWKTNFQRMLNYEHNVEILIRLINFFP